MKEEVIESGDTFATWTCLELENRPGDSSRVIVFDGLEQTYVTLCYNQYTLSTRQSSNFPNFIRSTPYLRWDFQIVSGPIHIPGSDCQKLTLNEIRWPLKKLGNSKFNSVKTNDYSLYV